MILIQTWVMAAQRVHMIIQGRVQGVFFRDYTVAEARRLGLSGWVRILRDGTVELEAEGEAGALAQLESWCHQGSPSARVTGILSGSVPPTGTDSTFSRRSTPRRGSRT